MLDARLLAEQLVAVDVGTPAQHDRLLLLGAIEQRKKRLLDAGDEEGVGAEDQDHHLCVLESVEPDDDSMLTKRDVLILCGRRGDKTESWVDQQVKAGRLRALREPGTVRDGVKLLGEGVRFRKSEVMRFRREEYKEVNR